MLRISTRFFPIRLMAFLKNSVELEVGIENNTNADKWIECDIVLPEAVSLAPERQLSKGRIRMGLVKASEWAYKKVKIYGGKSSYPELYPIKLVAYGFEGEGAVTIRSEKNTELRCERIGEEE